jgi:hypothetical protein
MARFWIDIFTEEWGDIMYKSLAVLLVLLSGLGTAEANKSHAPPPPPPPPARGPHFAAPEIDPAFIGGSIALLVGGLAVLRGRVPNR